ncbi:MAG: flagellar type III secretion system pore protein FliP [Clostridiaceae bacterium]|nr:flagellar type III secretion system pore protein FliP [Clostridiaceae bacterium]
MDGFININGDGISAIEFIFLTAMLTLLPSLVVMTTSFTRYVISLSFLRNALGTQQTPPNMVLVGIAMFLTLFTMGPTIDQINQQAYAPYVNGEIEQAEFFTRASVPLKDYMLHQTEMTSLELFCELSQTELPEGEISSLAEELPLRVVTPAFITSELKKAFQIGFYLYIPFLLIDVIVSSTLMSMGMIMLPPAMISTPFKLLLFITINGWELLFSTLVQGIR